MFTSVSVSHKIAVGSVFILHVMERSQHFPHGLTFPPKACGETARLAGSTGDCPGGGLLNTLWRGGGTVLKILCISCINIKVIWQASTTGPNLIGSALFELNLATAFHNTCQHEKYHTEVWTDSAGNKSSFTWWSLSCDKLASTRGN